jgi:hypothetical protein
VLLLPGGACDVGGGDVSGVRVQPAAVRGQEHRCAGALADGQVDRPGGARRERDGDDRAALAGNRESPVAAFQIEVLDVGAGGLGDPQPVQREQRDQRMLCRRPEPGGYQWRAGLVAVERGGVRLVVHPRTTDVRGG